MTRRRLSPAEVDRRRRIAARADLSRAEQAKLVGVSLDSWSKHLYRHRLDTDRSFSGAWPELRTAKLLRGTLVLKVSSDAGRTDYVKLTRSVLRVLGVGVGDEVRVLFDRHGRRLIVEAAGRAAA
jgi:hypothetical protein